MLRWSWLVEWWQSWWTPAVYDLDENDFEYIMPTQPRACRNTAAADAAANAALSRAKTAARIDMHANLRLQGMH